MKSKVVTCSLAIIALAFGAARLEASSKSHGADDLPGDDHQGRHHGETNEIEGHELFRGHVFLAPTTNAPARSRGLAELEQENEEGLVFYKVQVRAFGLALATYPVTAVLFSDGSTVPLGDFVVTNSRLARADLVLPAGVTVTDLGQIIVSDGGGNPVLAGDLNSATGGTSATFRSTLRLTPGPAAPDAKGKARLNINRRRGNDRERFNLAASRLPANTTFNILANGVLVGTATSNKGGALVIRSLQTDLTALTDLSLVLASDGTEALSAHF